MLSARGTLRNKCDNVDVMSEVLQIQNMPSYFFLPFKSCLIFRSSCRYLSSNNFHQPHQQRRYACWAPSKKRLLSGVIGIKQKQKHSGRSRYLSPLADKMRFHINDIINVQSGALQRAWWWMVNLLRKVWGLKNNNSNSQKKTEELNHSVSPHFYWIA